MAGRLPVEERVSRYTIQSWLSTRLAKEKENSDPKVVRKRAVAAAMKRILESAWGIDTSKLTKDELQDQLLAHECTISTRRRAGDFKKTDRKQRLVDLLHSKLPIPPTYVSVTAFLADAKEKAQAEGTAAVLAMSGATRPLSRQEVPDPVVFDKDESSSDTDDDMSLTQIRSNLCRDRRAARAAVNTQESESDNCDDLCIADFVSRDKDAVSSEESSDSDDSEVSTDDADGVVSVGNQFIYSDEENGDTTMTVRSIVRGGLVYVEEDDEPLCLEYVRKKVSVFE